LPRVAKSITDIRAEARKHTNTAIKTLVGIATQAKAPPAARVTAAQVLLDRGWGKAAQPHTGEDGEGPLVIQVVRFTGDNGKAAE